MKFLIVKVKRVNGRRVAATAKIMTAPTRRQAEKLALSREIYPLPNEGETEAAAAVMRGRNIQ